MDNADDEFDLDANNYSRKELLSLCDIPGDGSDVSVIKATNTRMIQYRDNPPVKQFFQDIQNKLLGRQREGFENWQDIRHTEEVEDEQEVDEFDEEEEQEEEPSFQNDPDIGKGLDAKDIYTRQHEMGSDPPVPARSNWKLGITDKTTSSIPVQQQTYLGAREVKQVPFAQGTINPRVKNMTQRIINIDSQYRSMPGGVSYKYPTPGCSTNYSVTLSESLKNSMSVTLNSYEIPYSWVGIDPARGNNKLVVSSGIEPSICSSCLTFSAGNWSLDYINQILSSGDDWPTTSSTPIPDVGYWTPDDKNICAGSSSSVFGLSLSVDKDGFVTITTSKAVTSTDPLIIHFWGPEVEKICSHGCSAVSTNYQSSLGWLLGFRAQSVTFPFGSGSSVTAPAYSVWATQNGWLGPSVSSGSCDVPAASSSSSGIALSCWKMTQYIPYLYVVLEDHNKNHNNKGVLNIIPAASVLSMPSYARQTGMKRDEDGNILLNEDGGVCDSSGSKPGDEVQPSYYNGEVVGGIYPEPQHLTQAQLYTIAAIKNNRTFRSPYSIPTGPSDSDILAKITLPQLDFTKFGKFIPDNGGSLQLNTRAYFGPVDLDRFTIKLIDNNGNLVNLNNRDWSFTLRVEQLYQY